jgi:hypothetical protein
VWYWKGDSEGGGHQDVWIRYSKEVCDAIEAARTAKQKEYKLDELRAISFKKMKQFVIKTPSRQRALKRETPAQRFAKEKRKAQAALKRSRKAAGKSAHAATAPSRGTRRTTRGGANQPAAAAAGRTTRRSKR